ncbi:MAG: DUF885 domain-containing protein [Bacteroidota bacterium]
MKYLSILILPAFLACQSAGKNEHASNTKDAAFTAFSNRLLDAWWKMFPENAAYAGKHDYDSLLTIPDEARRQKEISFALAYTDSIKSFDDASLSVLNRADKSILLNQMELIPFYNNEYKGWQWNPSGYNMSALIAELLAGKHAPLENRLRDICKRIAGHQAFFAAAKKNISSPSEAHTQLAIDQLLGSVSTLSKDLPDSIKASKWSEEKKKECIALAAEAAKSQEDFAAWLKKEALPTAVNDYRLGKERYGKKFSLEMISQFSAEQIYKRALSRKNELHQEMFRLTSSLWNKYFSKSPLPKDSLSAIKMLIEKISASHAKPNEFQQAIEKQIPFLTAFINKKKLLYLDESKPLVVRKEPEYMKGVAGASISAPGPYDKNANTYYNVGSLAGYSKEDAESYLREYNDYTLQILNIHEAIPGHYTQLVYANNSPSIVKSVFGNNAMIEGWAVYGERMMLENGYPNLESDSTGNEMWLMYYKWHLRTVCNTILDYSVHCLNMSKEQGLDLLIRQAFQEAAEAKNKWRRVSVTNVQLCCYFTGFTEIYELREAMKKKQGKAFDVKKWHETFLSFGSSPVPFISEAMLNEK